MKPLRIFSCLNVDVESNFPMRFSWKDIAEIHLSLCKKKISFADHLIAWFIAKCLCSHLEADLAKQNIPPKYGIRSLCLLSSLAVTVWRNTHSISAGANLESAFYRFMFKRDYTVKDKKWMTQFLDSRGQFFDDTHEKAAIVLSTLDENDIASCAVIVKYFSDATKDKGYHPIITSTIALADKILKADISQFACLMFENFKRALPIWEKLAARYNNGSSLANWAMVKQKLTTVITKLTSSTSRQGVASDVEAFITAANEAGATFAASVIAEKENNIRPHQIVNARVVEVDKAAGKSLRQAMKDPGGRPPKTQGGAKILTQAEMSIAFGEPCNESMVANWESRAAGKARGANPPDAVYNGERIIYSADLRKNPTPENQKRLSALIVEFQSRHRLRQAVDKKSETIHCRSDETLASARGQIDAAVRNQSQLKYRK